MNGLQEQTVNNQITGVVAMDEVNAVTKEERAAAHQQMAEESVDWTEEDFLNQCLGMLALAASANLQLPAMLESLIDITQRRERLLVAREQQANGINPLAKGEIVPDGASKTGEGEDCL